MGYKEDLKERGFYPVVEFFINPDTAELIINYEERRFLMALATATIKSYPDADATKLAGITEGAEVNPADLADLDSGAATKLAGIEALADVSPADLDELPDGTTRKAMSDTEKTKLTGVEDDATADQTGAEMRDAVVALADEEREIVITRPVSGEHKIYDVHRLAAGDIEYDYNDTPET